MSRIIGPTELQEADTVRLGRWLLGKSLVRTRGGERVASRIVEVEAYHGETDLACHASKGRTLRTDVMYSAGGVWYVYLCYGIHEMLNLVTGPEGFPSAILIRGVEGAVGPGRVTKTLGINRQLNRQPAHPESGLHLEDDGFVVPKRARRSGPRVGVAYAGPIWAQKPWRFWYELPRESQQPGGRRSGRTEL